MNAPKVDVLAEGLRRLCGHDSRSVDDCLTCEAADALEAAERRTAAVAELIEAVQERRRALTRGAQIKALAREMAALARIGGGA